MWLFKGEVRVSPFLAGLVITSSSSSSSFSKLGLWLQIRVCQIRVLVLFLSSLKVFSRSINTVYTTEGSLRILEIGFRLQWASSMSDN